MKCFREIKYFVLDHLLYLVIILCSFSFDFTRGMFLVAYISSHVFCKKHVCKKHEAEIRHILRNIYETQADLFSNSKLKVCFTRTFLIRQEAK